MANTDFNSVLSGTGAIARAALLQALEKRGAYVVEFGENPASLTPGNVTTICYSGVLFWYDSADATTAHDGVACIVTSDGKRFKSDGLSGAGSRWDAVKDKDVATPPASPAIGDRYIVATAGTGAWAAKDKRIAIYTARGWVFIIPKAFDYAYVIDEALIYHYSVAGVWTSGIPASTIADASISLRKFKYFPLGISIENKTTNTPPASPSDGVAYVVGGAPTGAWVGRSLDVAIYEVSAWVFYDPYEGSTVYDKSLDAVTKYNGSIWVSLISGYSSVSMEVDGSLFSGSTNLSTGFSYSDSTAPQTTTTHETDSVCQVVYAAKKINAQIEVSYQATVYVEQVNLGSGASASMQVNGITASLHVDSVVNAVDWALVSDLAEPIGAIGAKTARKTVNLNFILTAADTLSHTYKPKVFVSVNNSSPAAARVRLSRRKIILREVA